MIPLKNRLDLSPTSELCKLQTMVQKRTDNNGVEYTASYDYLENTVHVTEETLGRVHSVSPTAWNIFVFLLQLLKRNTNCVQLSNTLIVERLGLAKSIVSRAIKSLIAQGFIEKLDLHTYKIPITVAYVGNLTEMRRQHERNEENKQIEQRLEWARSKRRRKSKNNTDEQIPSN